MINRLDYFTTTINYTCSPVCLGFSINKVIIGRRAEGRAILSRPGQIFVFSQDFVLLRIVSSLSSGMSALWMDYISETEYKTDTNPHFFQK